MQKTAKSSLNFKLRYQIPTKKSTLRLNKILLVSILLITRFFRQSLNHFLFITSFDVFNLLQFFLRPRGLWTRLGMCVSFEKKETSKLFNYSVDKSQTNDERLVCSSENLMDFWPFIIVYWNSASAFTLGPREKH